ncbi:MAG: YqaA family protein [Nitrospirota bacterium]
MIRELYNWIIGWSGSPYASLALFLLSFAESSFFPLPPDILLMALAIGNPSYGIWFAAITTSGSILGGMVGYLIGYIGGKVLLQRVISREKIDKIHSYFERYEEWAIGIAGFTPIPYKVFTISGGAFYINFKKFVLISLLSRGGRFFLVAGTIQLFGEEVKIFIEKYFNILSILFVIILMLGFYMAGSLVKRRVVSK